MKQIIFKYIVSFPKLWLKKREWSKIIFLAYARVLFTLSLNTLLPYLYCQIKKRLSDSDLKGVLRFLLLSITFFTPFRLRCIF